MRHWSVTSVLSISTDSSDERHWCSQRAISSRSGISLDNPAMPKTRCSCASLCASVTWSGFDIYSSYNLRKVGLWSTGKSGAHSWKKTLTHLSENIRGGAVEVLGIETWEIGVVSPWMFKKASVLRSILRRQWRITSFRRNHRCPYSNYSARLRLYSRFSLFKSRHVRHAWNKSG